MLSLSVYSEKQDKAQQYTDQSLARNLYKDGGSRVIELSNHSYGDNPIMGCCLET